MKYDHQLSYAVRKLEDRLASRKLINKDRKEKRKISIRAEYILKMKKAYRTFLAKYYMKKEASILSEKAFYPDENDFNTVYGTTLEDVAAKKEMNSEKVLEHQAKLDEIQRIRAERNEEKAESNENVVPVASTEKEPEVPATNSIDDALAKLQGVQPITDNTPVAPTVKQSEEKQVTNEIDETISKLQGVQPIADNTPVAPIVEPEKSEDVKEAHETVSSINSNVELDPDVQNELSQSVQQIKAEMEAEAEEEKVELKDSTDINELVTKVAKFGNDLKVALENVQRVASSHSQIQRESVEILATKQKELEFVKSENSKLLDSNTELNNKNNELTATVSQNEETISKLSVKNNEKEIQIQELTSEGKEKDQRIDALTSEGREKDQKIDELTTLYNEQKLQNETKEQENAKLRSEMAVMSEQFQRMSAMFTNLQNVLNGTMQETNTAEINEGPQKTLS